MAATFWFLRRSAPTLAGALAGLAAGALGAGIYSWGCIEDGLPFVAPGIRSVSGFARRLVV